MPGWSQGHRAALCQHQGEGWDLFFLCASGLVHHSQTCPDPTQWHLCPAPFCAEDSLCWVALPAGAQQGPQALGRVWSGAVIRATLKVSLESFYDIVACVLVYHI